jgi:NAD(P)-dependent dehydrogenase (short-subunit alcohol dehydrogenase family)
MTWDIKGKRVLITGSNSGIGLASAKELCRLGANVLLTSRDGARGERAVAEIERVVPGAIVTCRELDLSQRASIETFAAGVLQDYESLEVLIHNAGVILSKREEVAGGVERTFMVNHLGPFLLQQLLQPLLIASAPARVICVASNAHLRARRGLNFEDLQWRRGYSAVPVYGASKLSNILFSGELARRLEGTGVTSNCLHPGVVATQFTRDGDAGGLWGFLFTHLRFLLLTPEKGARTSVHLATAPELEGFSGGYYSRRRLVRPSSAARDESAAQQLWTASERLLSVTKS